MMNAGERSIFGGHNYCIRRIGFNSVLFYLLLALIIITSNAIHSAAEQQPTCSARDGDDIDPNLQRHTFDIGYGEESFDFYVRPDVSTYYREDPGTRRAVQPKHVGFAAKWVNMSPQRLKLFWDPGDGGPGSLIGAAGPFQSAGTASFPTHKFYLADESGNVVARFVVKKGQSVYYYDPFEVSGDEAATQRNLQSLDYQQYEKYEIQKRTQLFNQKYREITGRDYLAIYPRDKPRRYHWPADYFGQEHWVLTKETHFKELPPSDNLERITARGRERILANDEPLLQEYRVEDQVMNITLKVLSCAPRAFEIPNFLSDVEVDHILELAGGMKLKQSTTGQGGTKADNRKTRTSLNTWVNRETTPIIDAIYRRAADLLRFDEALIRHRDKGEAPDTPESRNSIAEPLQLVHYGPGQEYTAHHDFGYTNSDDVLQPQRFATLLLYLNEPKAGGETSFPRWINGETREPLMVKPERGKAALFYSFLPDGNMDDLSHHAAVPVTEGEKWLINLWVRDPIH
mmetsp:Transcript_22604/g.49071  ORF Transcript_22604/g.49071 Transcript_22604/m.49071 type:complete len:515 (+) Transcript_22604:105-1649(+)